MWARIAVTTASIATLAGAVLATAAPADADSSVSYRNLSSAQFTSVGAHFKVCDEKVDGYGTRLDFSVVETGNAGSDQLADSGRCGTATLNASPGNHVRYRVCATGAGTQAGCSAWVEDVVR